MERSYEALKQKCQQLEAERSKLEDNNLKLSEEAVRQRNMRVKAEKELQAS